MHTKHENLQVYLNINKFPLAKLEYMYKRTKIKSSSSLIRDILEF